MTASTVGTKEVYIKDEPNKIKKRALLLFSGGFDSVALLHYMLENGYEPTLLFFNYDQLNFVNEHNCVEYWQKRYDLPLHCLSIRTMNWVNSVIVCNKEKEVIVDNQYIAMRNLIFLSYALSIAEVEDFPEIFVAFTYAPVQYKDADLEFLKMFDMLSYVTTGIEIKAPFIDMSRQLVAMKIVERYEGKDLLKDILNYSFSCNLPIGGQPCGLCPDCLDRKVIEMFI